MKHKGFVENLISHLCMLHDAVQIYNKPRSHNEDEQILVLVTQPEASLLKSASKIFITALHHRLFMMVEVILAGPVARDTLSVHSDYRTILAAS